MLAGVVLVAVFLVGYAVAWWRGERRMDQFITENWLYLPARVFRHHDEKYVAPTQERA